MGGSVPPNEKSPPNRTVSSEIYMTELGFRPSKVIVLAGFAPLEHFLQLRACFTVIEFQNMMHLTSTPAI